MKLDIKSCGSSGEIFLNLNYYSIKYKSKTQEGEMIKNVKKKATVRNLPDSRQVSS